MATVVALIESNGFAPELTSLGSNFRSFAYKSIDSPAEADAFDAEIFPAFRPDSGYWYSCVKWWRFKCTVAPVTNVTNLRIWQSSSPPSGCEIFITKSGTYRSITYGTSLPTIPGSPSPATMTVMTGNYASEGTAIKDITSTLTGTSDYSLYFSHCLRVASTTELGTLGGNWSLAWSFDES